MNLSAIVKKSLLDIILCFFRLVFFKTKELCMYGRFVHCDVQKKATYEDHDEEWRKVGAP